MKNIASRLEKIERLLLDRPCPECGAGGDNGELPVFRLVSPEEAASRAPPVVSYPASSGCAGPVD